MINLVIPMCGEALRFLQKGFRVPKPLIMVPDLLEYQHMIFAALDCIDLTNCNLIFVIRDDHVRSYGIDKILESYYPGSTYVILDYPTEGTLCTCLTASQYINNNSPLMIFTPDIIFEPAFDPTTFLNSNYDGMVLTFKANSPAHSYIKTEKDRVVEVAEKRVIGSEANLGVYLWKYGSDFVSYARALIKANVRVNNEFYIAPLYNFMIDDGLYIGYQNVKTVHVLGTPEDLDFYTRYVHSRQKNLPIALCADHSGFELKEICKNILLKQGRFCIDYGTWTEKPCDQADFLSSAVQSVVNGETRFGLSFCRSGQAFNIGANKYKNIISALIYDEYSAEHAVTHNFANFFSIPTRSVDAGLLEKMLNILYLSSPEGGRHSTRMMRLLNV